MSDRVPLRRRRFALRWAWSSPLLMAALATGMLATVVFDRALATMYEASRIRGEMESLAAYFAAEAAVADYVASSGVAATRVVDAGNGILVRTSIGPLQDGEQLQLTALVGEQQFDWLFARLPGGTSPVFGQPLSAADGVGLPAGWQRPVAVAPEDLPRLSCVEPADATGAMSSRLVADTGIALLRLSAGTDRDDYVLAPDREPGPLVPPPGGVHVVPGNLWVDQGERPLVVELDRDLTLLVHGNVYLGRSIRVQGRGHLTIASVVDGGVAFLDRDGNGRWSAGDELLAATEFTGPMEGAGNVYLGMPKDGRGTLEFDLGLVVGGALHAAADELMVHGPVVLHRGGAVLPERTGRLVATGARLPPVQRAVLPGFVATGAPRPGPLWPLSREPLYQADPAR